MSCATFQAVYNLKLDTWPLLNSCASVAIHKVVLEAEVQLRIVWQHCSVARNLDVGLRHVFYIVCICGGPISHTCSM